MANKVDALINVKDASGVLNEIYPITKKENVQGLAEFISNSLAGYAKKTDLDSYATESEVNTKLESYLPKSGGTLTGALTLKGEPTADLQAATKKYVDDSAKSIKAKAHKITLTVAGWDSTAKTQSATVSGVSATETAQEIHVTPATASMTAYIESGVYASAQAANQITFTASEKPTTDLTVYAVIRTL